MTLLAALQLCAAALAGGPPANVSIPVETLSPSPKPVPPLAGSLWLSRAKTEETRHRAVLLVHMAGRSKDDWSELAGVLQDEGFDTLAIDLRAKGNDSMRVLVEDVQSGVVFLRSDSRVEAERVTILAASAGANGAAHYAAASRQMAFILDGLALLSPNPEYKGVRLTDTLSSLMGIPVMLVAAKDDKGPAETVEKAKETCKTKCRSVILDGGGHGTNLLKSSAADEVKRSILEFLRKPYG